MTATETVTYRIRPNITSTRFAQAEPVARRGRPTTAWVLVTVKGKNLSVYSEEILEVDESTAAKKAAAAAKRTNTDIRAIPFSHAMVPTG